MPSVEVELENVLEEVRCECGNTLQWSRARRPGNREEEGIIEVTPCDCEYNREYKRGYDHGYNKRGENGYILGYKEGRESISIRITPPKSCLLF